MSVCKIKQVLNYGFELDSIDVPDGTVLPRSIYDIARPEFKENWVMWAQRLSVPEGLGARFPLAIANEQMADPPEIRKILKL